jgi:hypothetical protein
LNHFGSAFKQKKKAGCIAGSAFALEGLMLYRLGVHTGLPRKLSIM